MHSVHLSYVLKSFSNVSRSQVFAIKHTTALVSVYRPISVTLEGEECKETDRARISRFIAPTPAIAEIGELLLAS